MVLGMITGSVPMLFSLLLMQGITLTMWRSFLDKAIPRYNADNFRKNLGQLVAPPPPVQSAPSGDSVSAPLQPDIALQNSPPLDDSKSINQLDSVTQSLQILSKLDPNLIKLLSQLHSQNSAGGGGALNQFLDTPVPSSPELGGLQNSPEFDPGGQIGPAQYIHYNAHGDNGMKYIEVSSGYPNQKQFTNQLEDEYQQFSQDEVPNSEYQMIPEKHPGTSKQYKYVNIDGSPAQLSPDDEDRHPDVEIKDDEEAESIEEEEPVEEEEPSEQLAEEEEDPNEAQYTEEELEPDDPTMPSVIIGKPVPNLQAQPSKRRFRYLRLKGKSGRKLFGKPRLQKRMLSFETSPFQFAQSKLRKHIFDPFRTFSKNIKRPLSWKRTESVTNNNFRFVTPTVPVILLNQSTFPVRNLPSSPRELFPTQTNRVTVMMKHDTKDFKLKSKKLHMVMDESKQNCTVDVKIRNKMAPIWSQKGGWIQTDCNSIPPETDTVQIQLSKSISVKQPIISSTTTTTVSPLTTTVPIVEQIPPTTTTMAPTTTVKIETTTTTTTPSPTTTVATSTPGNQVISEAFLTNLQKLLSTLTTPAPLVTTTTREPTTTTAKIPRERMPQEFLLHILKVINASKIDNFQMNKNNQNDWMEQISKQINHHKSSVPEPITEDKEPREESKDDSQDESKDDSKDSNEELDYEYEDNLVGDNDIDGKMAVNHRFKRICYYLLNGGKDGQLDIEQLELHICSHLIVGYARISTSGLVAARKPLEDSEKYRRLTLMKLQYPHLKVMLSIGDLGGTMFSIVASSNRTRSRFIASVLDFCNEFNFDGVDIDWEFPGFRTGSKDDKKNFVLLLRELRKQANSAWKRKNKETKKSFLISVAVGAPLIIASTSYVIPEIGKYADFVNLMSYDFHYYRADRPYTGHHSPLYPRSTEQAYYSTLNVAWTATYWANKGMPLEKIIVGVPTYARTYNLVVPIGQNMMNVPANGPGIGKGKINYTQVCDFVSKPQTVKQFDLYSQVPYAYRNFDWIAYENEMSVAIKAQWVIKTGMGGIVTFALNFDDAKGTCRDDGKKFPLQKTISNLLELASIKTYKQSMFTMKVRDGS